MVRVELSPRHRWLVLLCGAWFVTPCRAQEAEPVWRETTTLPAAEATHLNTGFFWQGKLYCAHSNYPAKPERSELLVLDPESMELTTYHDFAGQGIAYAPVTDGLVGVVRKKKLVLFAQRETTPAR